MDAAQARPRSTSGDDGSIVIGWIVRLVLVLGVLGLIGFEVLSVAVARVSIEDYGQQAAQDAITAYQQTKSADLAYQAAAAVAEEHGAKIPKKSFTVTSDAAVSFDISTTATTLVLYRLGDLADWAKVRTTIYQEPIEESGIQP